MDVRLALLAITLVPRLGPATAGRLIQHFGSVEALLDSDEEARSAVTGVSAKTAREMGRTVYLEQAVEMKAAAEKVGLDLFTLADSDYPKRLRDIYDPPLVLWGRGHTLDWTMPTVSIVGMRAASSYGLWAAEHFARRLAERGILVVSGMARGIDTAAHRGAVEGGGRTVAVLGTGADVVYPPENAKLYKAISRQGVVLSEFAPGTPPMPGHFPRRNRIISGLAQGTLVIEAGEKSGALITAYMALDQGRDVFALPGDVRSMKSRGTHRLIQQGAKLVGSLEDILQEIFDLKSSALPPSPVIFEPHNLSPVETDIWAALSERPVHIDLLAQQCNRSPSEVMAVLLGMELKNWVMQQPGMLFKRRL